MRNFKLFIVLVAIATTSVFIYSCVKEKDMPESSGKSTASSTTSRSSAVNYPISNYVLWEIKNKPYTVIFTPSGTNNHVWIIQNEFNFTNESISNVASAELGLYNKAYLKLNYGNVEKVFSLASGLYQNYPANAIGFSKVIDEDLLSSLRTLSDITKDEVIDDVSEKATCRKDGTSDTSCKCAGGANSTSCECGGSIAGVSWHEQQSCKEGFYACCPGL